jgi:hypothetical protein
VAALTKAEFKRSVPVAAEQKLSLREVCLWGFEQS